MSGKHVLLLILSCTVLLFSCRKKNNNGSLGPGNDTIPDDPAQTLSYELKAVYEETSPHSGGYYEALPSSYATGNDKFPLLMFFHGGGELGDGGAVQLPLVLKHSVAKRIAEKTLPASFTVGGKEYSFIVIIPQFRTWPTANAVNEVLTSVLAKYRVDTTRIYMAGLSMGGGATWEFAGSANGKKLAAIVPICGASWADSAVARHIAGNKVPAWAFHNDDDPVVTVNSTRRYARMINAADPAAAVRVTIWPTGGHDAWTRASDPSYKENGKNMYEWMLGFKR